MGVDENLRNRIVSMHLGGSSKRKISRTLGISRNTVRRILGAEAKARARGRSALPNPPTRRGSKLDKYDEYMREMLELFPDLTAVRLLEMLKLKGFDGEYTIVKKRLRQLRPKPKKTPVTRFETEPGDQGQQDWSPYMIPFVDNGSQLVKAFSLVLGYSRRQYLRFGEDETFYTLIRQHKEAFEHFKGAPRNILYDRQKAVVLGWEAGHNLYNPRFLAFATHYGFRPHALPPRKPHLKGKVERPFDYIEKNLLNGRTFRNLVHLNEFTTWWLENRADVRNHGTLNQRPIDRFAQEAPHLLPLPAHPFDTAEVGYRVVSIEGTVSWAATEYSVPFEHLLEVVVVRVTEHEVFVFDSELNQLACHQRAPRGQREPVVDANHRPKSKPRYDVEILAQRMAELGEQAALFAAGIIEKQRFRGAHLSRVLGLVERYSAKDLLSAIERALKFRAFDSKVVQRILEASATVRPLPQDSDRAAKERLDAMPSTTNPRDLDQYDAVLKSS